MARSTFLARCAWIAPLAILSCGSGASDAGSAASDGSAPLDGSTLDAPAAALGDAALGDDADSPTIEAGPAGPWLAFASNRTGLFGLYQIHPDGSGFRPLVQDAGTNLSPAWSPDGTRIAFVSERDDAGAYRLFVLDVASEHVRSLVTGVGGAASPNWSPDGTRIAFSATGRLYTTSANGGTATPLTTEGFRDTSPVWAPDGGALYFSSDRETGQSFDVWSVLPDGGGLTQVTTGSRMLGGVSVSPDGATLALTEPAATANDGASTLVTFFDLATKTSTVFTDQGDYEPAFSPDGSRLAVTSTRYAADKPEIVILGIPGATNPFRLTRASGTNGQAAWQPWP